MGALDRMRVVSQQQADEIFGLPDLAFEVRYVGARHRRLRLGCCHIEPGRVAAVVLRAREGDEFLTRLLQPPGWTAIRSDRSSRPSWSSSALALARSCG